MAEPTPVTLTSDERAGIRAYLQRSEVRLSTLHRVATALLSGAGLVVLLPAIERDSVVVVLRSLFTDLDLTRGLLAAAMIVVLSLPLVALWLLLRELTRFYFHAQHLHVGASAVFVPRFTLTGLRLPADELSSGAADELRAIRRSTPNVELLVPAKDTTRRRIDRQLASYQGVGEGASSDDADRADGLLDLVASRDRSLLEEAAKVEYGMARHLLRLQAIVLRYVKALLAFVTTALAVFAAAAVVDGSDGGPAAAVVITDQVWLAAIVLVWSPCIVAVVSTPVRWVEQLLRSEGATQPSVSRDPELTQVERIAVWIAGIGWVLAAAAAVSLLAAGQLSGSQPAAVISVLVATAAAHAAGLRHRSST